MPRQRSLRRVLSAIGGAAGTRRRASICNGAEQRERQHTVLIGSTLCSASRGRAWPLTPENTPALATARHCGAGAALHALQAPRGATKEYVERQGATRPQRTRGRGLASV